MNSSSISPRSIVFSFLLLLGISAHAQAQVGPLSIGERLTLHSDILEEDRVLNIYLPHGYGEDSLKEYPVIYLLDGSMDEDFIHIAGLVQFGSFSWIQMIPETIVVGISNVDRKRDFTYPTRNKKDKKDFPTTGGSEKFISFLAGELQPQVEARYRTNGTKTIIGQSLGGLLASEILYKQPEMFDNYVIVSPSLWWDDESLLETEMKERKKAKSIYVAVGKEGKVMERVAKELHGKLETGKGEEDRVFFSYFEAQNHGDALHLAVYDAFEKLFAKEEN